MFENTYIAYMQSPIGLIEIQANKREIIRIEFVEEKSLPPNVNPIIQEAIKQLEEYFFGERKVFDLPLKIFGSPFQETVWKELLKIPYGMTLSYGNVAKNIGNYKASRAVGNANNKNKISIVIPCHRVIGASGKLVGYGGGVWRKKWLLEHEKKHV